MFGSCSCAEDASLLSSDLQYASSSSNSFIHCTLGTWSCSEDFTRSWIISAVCLRQDAIVWDHPIETLQKNFWRQVLPGQRRPWAPRGRRLEHSVFWGSRVSRSPTSPGRQMNVGLSAQVQANISRVIYRECRMDIVFLKTHRRPKTYYFFVFFSLFFRQDTTYYLFRVFCKPPVLLSQDKHLFA